MDYKILQDTEFASLENRVFSKLKEGYLLTGGVCVMCKNDLVWYYQAVYRN